MPASFYTIGRSHDHAVRVLDARSTAPRGIRPVPRMNPLLPDTYHLTRRTYDTSGQYLVSHILVYALRT